MSKCVSVVIRILTDVEAANASLCFVFCRQKYCTTGTPTIMFCILPTIGFKYERKSADVVISTYAVHCDASTTATVTDLRLVLGGITISSIGFKQKVIPVGFVTREG